MGKVRSCIGHSKYAGVEMAGVEAVMTHPWVSYCTSLWSGSWDDVEFGSAANNAKPITT